jgi:hypothetical protein
MAQNTSNSAYAASRDPSSSMRAPPRSFIRDMR